MTELDLISPAIDKLNGYIIAGNILWITSLCISKLAIIAMLLRTTQTLHHRRCQYGVGTLIVAQFIASILLLTVNCSAHSEFAWNMTSVNSECPQMERRWHVLTALDAMTEILLLFLPIQLVWSLQMSFRTKITVISAFWLRLPYVPIPSTTSVLADHAIEPSSSLLFARGRCTNLQQRQMSHSQLL